LKLVSSAARKFINLKFLIMKTLIYLFVVVMLLFAGCAKDDMFTSNMKTPSPELKRANVPVPMKTDLCAVPDPTSSPILKPKPGLDPNDPNSYIPSVMIISGTGTHLGKIDSEKSYYRIEVFSLTMVNGVLHAYQAGDGFLAGSNGDGFNYTWWAKTSMTTLEYFGETILVGGTGKFEGCSGTTIMAGKVDQLNGTNCWTADGHIKFK
jgi:hypothetical protein